MRRSFNSCTADRTRTGTDVSRPSDFHTTIAFTTKVAFFVCSLDFLFTMEFSLGVSCQVSAPSILL
jgi:hypothetical protein